MELSFVPVSTDHPELLLSRYCCHVALGGDEEASRDASASAVELVGCVADGPRAGARAVVSRRRAAALLACGLAASAGGRVKRRGRGRGPRHRPP